MDDTLFARVKAAAAARVRALKLATFGGPDAPTRVYGQIGPETTNVTFPCILLTSEGEAEELPPADFEGDEVAWKIRVWFVDRATPRQHEKEPGYTRDRRRLIRAFHRVPTLAGVPEVYECTVLPAAVFDPALLAKEYQTVAGSLVLRFVTYEQVERW